MWQRKEESFPTLQPQFQNYLEKWIQDIRDEASQMSIFLQLNHNRDAAFHLKLMVNQ